MDRVLHELLTLSPSPKPMDSIDAWWQRHCQAVAGFERSIHRAMVGGFAADRPAYAFASGYQEALRRLLGIAGLDDRPTKMALCATEEGGNRPSAIKTRLEPDGDGYRLNGNKRWATLGSYAESLLIFASVGLDESGRNRITAVHIPADRQGVNQSSVPAAEQPFLPEIPHSRLELDNVRVAASERLDGDGYALYLKPFRTVEDCHVYAALAAWLLQVARRSDWPQSALEAITLSLAGVSAIASGDHKSPATHIALAGLVAQANELLTEQEANWANVDEQTRSRWQRDQVLLKVAGKARSRRREVAWQRLG